ncbi:MAG: heavy metal translocating P-type ATPase [Aggregatilineales bacterium]
MEPRLVVITLMAILGALVAERLEAAQEIVLILHMTSYVAGGFYGAKSALESLRVGRLDVDLLMILAALGAAVIGQWTEGATLLFLFSLSNVLQDYAIGRSRQAIRGLLKLYPSEAKVRRNNQVVVLNVSVIERGDVILIEPGERIPVDGIVLAGRSSVDEAPITGESLPVEKEAGARVFAGTLNQQGALDIEASGQAKDTVLARIIKMVEEAQESKAPTERFLDRFEQIYATLILAGIGLFILIPPSLGWADFTDNFYRAMVLMTVASPCALIISTPAAFISAIASGARGGVLFKGGAYLELLSTIKGVTFDKTGTLTKGRPALTDLVPVDGVSEKELLAVAAAVEARSEHPLAKAVVRAAQQRSIPFAEADDFEALTGRGVRARLAGQWIEIGSPAYLLVEGMPPDELRSALSLLEAEGKTVMLVRRAGEWLGLLALADEIRPEAKAVIDELHARGIQVAMLTGDNARVASHIAGQLGIDRVHAGLMPEDKVKTLRAIEQEVGPVAMIGDGVNDAPALANATIGIAMGAVGTDVALETADIVLMGDRLELIPYAIDLSRKARRVVWQNLTFSIAVIVVLMVSVFTVDLPLTLGVLGHEGSTVIVVMNGLISLLLIPEIRRRRAQAAVQTA